MLLRACARACTRRCARGRACVCVLVLVSTFVIMVENVFGVHRLVFVVAIVLLLPL